MDYDVKTTLRAVSAIIDDEVGSIKNHFYGKTYDGGLFSSPVTVSASIKEQDLADVPKGNGIYVFEIIVDFTNSEYVKFKSEENSIKATKLRNETKFDDLKENAFLYIGSCKAMGIRARLKEHLFHAGNGVYSLRLYDKDNREMVKKKIEITAFEMNTFGNQDYVKLLLPRIEEKLQKELRPVAGRYRG